MQRTPKSSNMEKNIFSKATVQLFKFYMVEKKMDAMKPQATGALKIKEKYIAARLRNFCIGLSTYLYMRGYFII